MSRVISVVASVLAVLALSIGSAAAQGSQVSKPFAGPKANAGTVTHTMQGNKHLLTLSDDFKVPDTPDPHWQIVDSKGRVYLLDRLMIKGDKLNKTITLPAFVPDVTKVVIWCAWAEANLGEATFTAPVMTH
jgi:hypothetical protein